MKQFFTVLDFELKNYFKNKGYVLTTLLISIILIIGITLPSFVDLSGLIPSLAKDKASVEQKALENKKKDKEENKFAIYYDSKLNLSTDEINSILIDSTWEKVDNKQELEKLVKEEKVKGGFLVNSLEDYTYVVKNTSLTDSIQKGFEEYLKTKNRQVYAQSKGLDYNELNSVIESSIQSNVNILEKDGAKNFGYAYILIFATYLLILLYGQLIAVSVTSEKSNRAIEVLVTSASSNSLIFGKVIAGAIASVVQVCIILGSGIITYSLNKKSWNGMLDMIFNIPSDLLLTFALFGTFGYLFYAFIFGALGALVSKTEDVSKSIGPVIMIFVAVFCITMFNLTNVDSTIIKVASYIPFSSFMTMLARVGLGKISMIEIMTSFGILLVSTIIVALGAAKIFRLGTLMYGNPIKLKNALKWFKKTNS